MMKLLLLPFFALALFACEKDDDPAEPEAKTTNTNTPSNNTEYIFTADTSIKQIYYTDSDGNFKAEVQIDPELRRWTKQVNNSIGDTIEFGGSVVTFQNKAEIQIIYNGDGKLDTINNSSALGSASFKAAVVP